MSAVICAIAFEEDAYLHEWITYHLILGFSHIYLHDNTPGNDMSPFMHELIKHYPNHLTIYHSPGKAMQYPAYRHFLASAESKRHKWVSFHDIDEFIVLHKHSNIVDFLKEHCPEGSVSLNWCQFGTGFQKGVSNQPVLKRFRYRTDKPDQHVKCISCIEDVETVYNAHFVSLKHDLKTKDTHGNVVVGPFNHNGSIEIAQMNHYFSKSDEEHRDRRGNNKLTGDGLIRTITSDEDMKKCNETYDDRAWLFYKSHVRRKNNML